MIELKVLMNRLPRENYDLLHEISKLLRITAQNSKATKMPLSNLLLVFCPSLQLSPTFLKVVIERQDYLFGDGEMGHVAPSRTTENSSQSSGSRLRGGTAHYTRRSKEQVAQVVDDSKRNRTASIYVPPNFNFTIEAYSEPLNLEPPSGSSSQPSRPITPVSLAPLSPNLLPGTPSSSSSSQGRAVEFAPLPVVQPTSIRSRQPSAARRQPSLASLFGGGSKPSTPVISAPIPIAPPRSETPSEPPTLDVQLPDGSFSVSAELSKLNGTSTSPITSPLSSVDSPQTSDLEHFRLAPAMTTDDNNIPRPIASQGTPLPTSPPQLPMLANPNRVSVDDWASSVLLAAGSSN